MGAAVPTIEENSLRVVEGGYAVNLRLNWYRTLPLSCVEDVRFSLDGQPVDREDLRFVINGHSYRLDELVELVEEYWFVQDAAELKVEQPGKVSQGETHTVDATVVLRFPYIPIGPGRFLTNINQYSAAQKAA